MELIKHKSNVIMVKIKILNKENHKNKVKQQMPIKMFFRRMTIKMLVN